MSLRNGSPSERVFATSFLALLGLGYALALVYMLSIDILPHMRSGYGLVTGISRTFHGGEGDTRLEAVLKGRMAFAVRSDDMERVQQWIQTGATREGYKTLDRLVQMKCANCHRPGWNPPPVQNYEELHLLLQKPEGKPVQVLARTTHVHLFTIPLMLFPLGLFFTRTRFSERLKCVLVALPFAALIWDIAHWWLTRMYPSAAWGVMLGGGVLFVGFLAQWTLCLWDIWRPLPEPSKGSQEENIPNGESLRDGKSFRDGSSH